MAFGAEGCGVVVGQGNPNGCRLFVDNPHASRDFAGEISANVRVECRTASAEHRTALSLFRSPVFASLVTVIDPAATLSISSNASLSPLPGMLPPGEHALQVTDVGQSSRYKLAEAPDPTVVVSDSGQSQTQTFNLAPGVVKLTVQSPTALVSPFGVYLKELTLQGLVFRADPPVLYRPLNLAGALVPLQRWSWTLQSEAGGVTLSQSSMVQLPSVEMVRGQPVLVQRIDSTISFSGNAVGTITLTHWDAVGDPGRMREQYQGEVTAFNKPAFTGTAFASAAFDETSVVDTTVVLGGLGGPPVG